MTPQIDRLWKMSIVLRVSAHIYSKEIDGKMFIFRVNLGMWPLKSIVSEKRVTCSEGFNTHLWGFSWDRWENMFIFRVNLGMWPLKSIISEKQALFCGIQHTSYEVSKEIDGKMFIFRVNLGMWPHKSIVSQKWALFWGFQHTFMGSFRR